MKSGEGERGGAGRPLMEGVEALRFAPHPIDEVQVGLQLTYPPSLAPHQNQLVRRRNILAIAFAVMMKSQRSWATSGPTLNLCPLAYTVSATRRDAVSATRSTVLTNRT